MADRVRLRASDTVRLLVGPAPPVAVGPSNLATEWGKFYRADVVAGSVRVQYAESVIPAGTAVPSGGSAGFATSVLLAGGGSDGEPKLVEDHRRRLYCLLSRGGGVHQAASDTEGSNFFAPAELAASASRPVAAAHPQSGVLVRGWRGSGGPASAMVNHPGEDPAAAAAAALAGVSLDDDSWSIVPGFDGAGRWWLIGVFGTVIQVRWSADDLATWTLHSTLLSEGRHPILAVREGDGMLVAGAWFADRTVKLCSLGMGESAFSSPRVVAGPGVHAFTESSFGLAAAHEEAARWVLTAIRDGDSEPSEFWCTNEGDWTFKRVG